MSKHKYDVTASYYNGIHGTGVVYQAPSLLKATEAAARWKANPFFSNVRIRKAK